MKIYNEPVKSGEYDDKNYPLEHIENLWHAVLNNAVNEAAGGNSYVKKHEIEYALSFIKGETRALSDICSALNLDVNVTKETLLKKYHKLLEQKNG